jgi:hypothetical protein
VAEKHYNAAGTHVLVHNPENGARWESSVGYLPIALARGWELAEPVEETPAELAAVHDEPQRPVQKTTAKARRKTTPNLGD